MEPDFELEAQFETKLKLKRSVTCNLIENEALIKADARFILCEFKLGHR